MWSNTSTKPVRTQNNELGCATSKERVAPLENPLCTPGSQRLAVGVEGKTAASRARRQRDTGAGEMGEEPAVGDVKHRVVPRPRERQLSCSLTRLQGAQWHLEEVLEGTSDWIRN